MPLEELRLGLTFAAGNLIVEAGSKSLARLCGFYAVVEVLAEKGVPSKTGSIVVGSYVRMRW